MKKVLLAISVLSIINLGTAKSQSKMEKATLGGGCFWCVEAVYEEVEGITSVTSGYMGGHIKNPSYKDVTSGRSGHAEVVQLTFDPEVISYKEILEIFWMTHDPTTLNRQGNDIGPQYRSAVFYHNDEQKRVADFYLAELDKSGAYRDPIVTEITEASEYYKAEDYHQDYYSLNRNQPYCQFVIRPKLEKFRKAFSSKLKAVPNN